MDEAFSVLANSSDCLLLILFKGLFFQVSLLVLIDSEQIKSTERTSMCTC